MYSKINLFWLHKLHAIYTPDVLNCKSLCLFFILKVDRHGCQKQYVKIREQHYKSWLSLMTKFSDDNHNNK